MLFNEPKLLKSERDGGAVGDPRVSVLFNEPKLLKLLGARGGVTCFQRFSALQRAEIAEIDGDQLVRTSERMFQCSSTSRNC